MRLGGSNVVEKLEQMQGSGHYFIDEIYVKDDGKFYEVGAGEFQRDEECLVKVKQSLRGHLEEHYDDGGLGEVALSRKMKQQLRKSQNAIVNAEEANRSFAADVSEVYSEPRIVKEAVKKGLRGGGSYDLKTGYDLRLMTDYRTPFSLYAVLLADPSQYSNI